jgi:hypothetical protein
MDLNGMIVDLSQHLTPVNVGIFVLILAQEIIANTSLFSANSLGDMLMKFIKSLLANLWSAKK